MNGVLDEKKQKSAAQLATEKNTGVKAVPVKTYQSVGNVYRTFDYDMFKYMHGNRKVRPNHLTKLIKSFKDEQLLVPIIVNEKMEIIDGQHSFNAAMAVKGPIYFIIADGYGLRQVQKLNENNVNWSVDERMHSYCDSGLEDYVTYRDFKIKYAFGHQETIALLLGSTSSFTQVFNDGNLKISNLAKATELAEKIIQFKPYYKGYKRKSFVYAYIQLVNKVKGFDHDEMIKKVARQSTLMVDCTNKDEYLRLLEKIYNFHRGKNSTIRFI